MGSFLCLPKDFFLNYFFAWTGLRWHFLRKLFGCTSTISSISCCKLTTFLLRKSTIDPPSAAYTLTKINSESRSSLQWCNRDSFGIVYYFVHFHLKTKQKQIALSDKKKNDENKFMESAPYRRNEGRNPIICKSFTCSAVYLYLLLMCKSNFKRKLNSGRKPTLLCLSHGFMDHKTKRL